MAKKEASKEDKLNRIYSNAKAGNVSYPLSSYYKAVVAGCAFLLGEREDKDEVLAVVVKERKLWGGLMPEYAKLTDLAAQIG